MRKVGNYCSPACSWYMRWRRQHYRREKKTLTLSCLMYWFVCIWQSCDRNEGFHQYFINNLLSLWRHSSMYYQIHFKMVIKMDITCREIVWGVSTIKYKSQFLSAKVCHETWIKYFIPVLNTKHFILHIVKNKLITYVCIYHKCSGYI